MSKTNFSSQNTNPVEFHSSNHSFLWKVNVLNSTSRQECFRFPYLGSSNAEITIKISEDDIKIYILVEKQASISQLILCKFMLLDVKGKERGSRRATHLFENAESWEFPTFIKKSQLYAEKDIYLEDESFTLQCDITVSNDNVVKKIAIPSGIFTAFAMDTFVVLNEDLKRLYEDKIHTDLKLKAGKEVFLAHKSILCARSPVFMAMFDNDMAESQRGEVDISDLDAETVGLLLEYIYTETVNDLDYENAMKLIVAAEKYQVLTLKNKCADLLVKMLSDDNICEILVTADLVQHDALKASVLEYIKIQPKKIFKSEKWKQCVKNNLLLATETASEVAIMLGDQAK